MPDVIHLPSVLLLRFRCRIIFKPLCDELNDTAGVLDLLFGFGADVTRANNDWDLNATLAQ